MRCWLRLIAMSRQTRRLQKEIPVTLKPDLRICRTHMYPAIDTSSHHKHLGVNCDIIDMVWSADAHALLEIEECEACVPPTGDGKGTVCLGYHPETDDGPGEYEWGPCSECRGEGWRYTAQVLPSSFRDDADAVAVVPLR